MKMPPLTDEEKLFIHDNHATMTVREISDALGRKHANFVYAYMGEQGLSTLDRRLGRKQRHKLPEGCFNVDLRSNWVM